MGLLTPAMINLRTDKMDAGYLAAQGTTGSGLGLGNGNGSWGLSQKEYDLAQLIAASGDPVIEAIETPLVTTWPTPTLTQTIMLQSFFSYFSALNRLGLAAQTLSSSIINFDTLMYWYNFLNGSSYWQCLAPPDWVPIYQALNNGAKPNQLNCYFPVIQGASYGGVTFTNALGKLVVVAGSPTTTLGVAIDQTTYAGGFAYAVVSGLTGTGTLTVNGLDQNGAAEVWTFSVTTNGTVLLVPTNHPYSLITSVVSITRGSGITAATIYIESHPPSGRSYPPT